MEEIITPRNNQKLFGHDKIETALLSDLTSGRLAHGIILSGERGIGKATLAYRITRTLLAGGEARIASGSHSDLLVIEREYNEKKEEFANEISVEQVREIPKFLSLTAGEGRWRVVIIDGADAMNNAAANAILKILEEPPQRTVLILITHNMSKLLPTIRSRCRLFTIPPLSSDDFSKAIRHVAPDIYGNEQKLLEIISGRSVGLAIELRNIGATNIYNEIVSILSDADEDYESKLIRFCESITGGKKHANWQLFVRLFLCVLERITKTSVGASIAEIDEHETESLRNLASMFGPEVWANKWQTASSQLTKTSHLHLDYKLSAMTALAQVRSAEQA